MAKLSTTFQFLKDTFDGIPIPMGDVLELEPVLEECSFEPLVHHQPGTQQFRRDVSAELRQELIVKTIVLAVPGPEMQEFVGFRSDASVQPVPFVIELNYGFVECDVILDLQELGCSPVFRTQL